MTDRTPSAATLRLGRRAALATAAGVVLSGPVALVVLAHAAPQPPWAGVDVYVAHFAPLQALPFALGALLVAGSVALVVAASERLAATAPARARLATMAATVFAALVGFNYVVQTTFVPALVADGSPEARTVLAAVTMANPRSLAWALEMWGYGVLGVATWLAAPGFHGLPGGRLVAGLAVANGVVSLAGGVLASVRLALLATPAGFALFLGWNALVLVLAIAAARAFGARGRV